MKTIVITLPLPGRDHSPNGRAHYMKRHAARKIQRIAAWALAVNAIDGRVPPRWKRATMHVRWYHPTLRFPDADNCLGSLKGAIDGLADAGILDDDKGLEIGGVTREKDAARPRVEIEIEGIETQPTLKGTP